MATERWKGGVPFDAALIETVADTGATRPYPGRQWNRPAASDSVDSAITTAIDHRQNPTHLDPSQSSDAPVAAYARPPRPATKRHGGDDDQEAGVGFRLRRIRRITRVGISYTSEVSAPPGCRLIARNQLN